MYIVEIEFLSKHFMIQIDRKKLLAPLSSTFFELSPYRGSTFRSCDLYPSLISHGTSTLMSY